MLRHMLTIGFILFALGAQSASITIKVYGTDDEHQEKGTITFRDSPGGLLINLRLHDLPPGPHGLHIHQNPSCRNHGMAAGEHLDPKHTHNHLGPYGEGHLGDLPVMYVNADREARASLIAPRLSVESIEKRSIVIHAAGDNYTNTPPLGGGGPRIACGVIR